MAGPRQVIDIPIAAGLNTKADPRAMQPPGLAVCEDVQFDELGGVQTRPQYQAITDSASNTIADIRKIVEYGDELVAFSKDKLWSYASGDGLWTSRGDYLAVKVDEQPRFVTTGEQFDCDRAELDGVTMYAWSETTPSSTLTYVAAIDTISGAVKMSPTSVGAVVRPRLSITTNKIVFTVISSTNFVARVYEPSDLTYNESTMSVTAGSMYDVVQDPGDLTTLLGVVTEATQYQIFDIAETSVVTSNLTRVTTADGACAISATAALVAVCYSSGTAVKTDLRDAALTTVVLDIATGTAQSTTVNHITAAHDGTLFRVFWSAQEVTTFVNFDTEHNTVTNAGSAGAETCVVVNCALASRPIVHDSTVFVWVVFSKVSTGDVTAELQNSYFLYRYDGELIAKSVAATAGGFSVTEGALPWVQNTSGNIWSWCGMQKRIIPLGQQQKGYTAKSPTDITIEFDSAEARRTTVLGETMYIAGGQMSQYDGRSITEVGFHTFPWFLGIGTGDPGNLNGTYNFLSSFAWYNAKGEFERSTTATIDSEAMVNDKATTVASYLWTTLKTGAAGEVAVEFWRQIAAAPVGAPFYLVTSKDPASTGDNAYQENDITGASSQGLIDDLSDASLISLETWPENGGLTLASLPPPAASIIHATQDRLILAGIPGYPYRIVYSRLRGSGEIASFNDSLFVDLPPAGGPITAIGFLNETLIVFKASAVYALPGDGYDNNGGGQNYGPARLLDNDVGAISAEGIELTPKGILFKSNKGWFVLTQGWQAQYVGVGADAYDSDTIVSCHSMDSQHQVRCVSSARTLLWDYLVDAWFVWTNTSVSATMWGNVHHYVNAAADGVLAQASTYSGSGDLPGLDLESAWIKTSGIQGFGLIRRVLILGEYLGACDLRIRVAYNYKETSAGPVWVDDKTWTVSPTTVNGPLQLEHGPSRPKCQSLKIRITAQAIGVTTHPISQAINLTALSLEVAIRQGAFAGLPATQKQ